MSKFNKSKAKVREINLRALENCLEDAGTARIKYFGLPSPNIEDLELIKSRLESAHAVERGYKGEEWRWQHELTTQALLAGIPNFKLYCGDIDRIILSNVDINNLSPTWDYNFVNLDYTGGITYKDEMGQSERISALKKLVQNQSNMKQSFFLTITVNDKHHDSGEISRFIKELKQRYNDTQQALAILENAQKSPDMRMTIYFYTSCIIEKVASNWYRCEILKPILYTGRSGYRMLNMSYCLKYMTQRDAPATSKDNILSAITKEGIIFDEHFTR